MKRWILPDWPIEINGKFTLSHKILSDEMPCEYPILLIRIKQRLFFKEAAMFNNITPVRINSQKIVLGQGYQKVSGQFVSTGIKKVVPNNVEDPKFSYQAVFCETMTELTKQLNVAVGLTGQAYNVKVDLSGGYSNKTDRKASAGYYLVEFNWILSYDTLGTLQPDDILPDIKQGPGQELKSFYETYGNTFVSRVDYGQKLVAIVEIDAKNMSKSTQWLAKVGIAAPLPGGASVGGNLDITRLITAIQDQRETKIQIVAIGIDTPDLQLKVIKDIVELRTILAGITTGKPEDASKPAPAASPDSKSKPAADNAKDSSTKDSSATPKPAASTKSENGKAVEEKENSKADSSTKKTDAKAKTVISFQTSPYSALLSQTEQNATKTSYGNLRKHVSLAMKFIKIIFSCQTRLQQYSNLVQYVLRNHEVVRTNEPQNKEITALLSQINEHLEACEVLKKLIQHSVFNDATFSEHDLEIGKLCGEARAHLDAADAAIDHALAMTTTLEIVMASEKALQLMKTAIKSVSRTRKATESKIKAIHKDLKVKRHQSTLLSKDFAAARNSLNALNDQLYTTGGKLKSENEHEKEAKLVIDFNTIVRDELQNINKSLVAKFGSAKNSKIDLNVELQWLQVQFDTVVSNTTKSTARLDDQSSVRFMINDLRQKFSNLISKIGDTYDASEPMDELNFYAFLKDYVYEGLDQIIYDFNEHLVIGQASTEIKSQAQRDYNDVHTQYLNLYKKYNDLLIKKEHEDKSVKETEAVLKRFQEASNKNTAQKFDNLKAAVKNFLLVDQSKTALIEARHLTVQQIQALKDGLKAFKDHADRKSMRAIVSPVQGARVFNWGNVARQLVELMEAINNFSSTMIDFNHSAILLASMSCKYHGPFNFSSSSKYEDLVVPFETHNLIFDVAHNSLLRTDAPVGFDLERRHAIHITGHESEHHLLHANLEHGSRGKLLNIDVTKALSRQRAASDPKMLAGLGTDYETKVYHQVRVKTVKPAGFTKAPVRNYQFIPRGGHPYPPEDEFLVRIFSQIGESIKRLEFPNANKIIKTDYNPEAHYVPLEPEKNSAEQPPTQSTNAQKSQTARPQQQRQQQQSQTLPLSKDKGHAQVQQQDDGRVSEEESDDD